MSVYLSITTDYLEDTGNPEPYLKRISKAGFTHVHWCHQWNTDFIYSESEINQIAIWLKKYNLKALDIHASEKNALDGTGNWLSQIEAQRKNGIELVKNRIFMSNKLSCEVIILHFKREPDNESEKQKYWNVVHKSLDELRSYAQKYNVKIALENYDNENSHEIKKLLSEYGSDFLGLCYDSGHGNIGNGIKTLEELKDRLISIHLHDNNGKSDQHKLLFSGTLDWDKLARIIAKSSYKKCISMEVSMKNSNIPDETMFLSRAYENGLRFSKMVRNYYNDTTKRH